MLPTHENGHAASGSASGGPDSNTAHSIYKTVGSEDVTQSDGYEVQPGVKVVGTHVDWLTCSVTLDLPDEVLDSLYTALGGSNGEPVDTELEAFGEMLVLRPRLGGELVLKNDYLYLETQNVGDVRLSVTVYSRAFWDFGEAVVVEQLQQFVDGLYGRDEGAHVALKPSRVDLCRDLQGFDLERFSDGKKTLKTFVSRLRNAIPYVHGDRTETVYLGKPGGKVRLRMYNKSIELKKSKKDYYTNTWEAHQYDRLRDVVRIEFELRRDFFAHWEVEGVGQVDTIQQLLLALNGIWQYLTLQHTRFIVPDTDESNVSRLVTHEDWETVAAIYLPDLPNVAGVRVKRYSPQRERACKQMFGNWKTICALTPGGVHYTQEEFERGLVHEFRRFVGEGGVPFVGEVHKRDLKIRAGGRSAGWKVA